MLNIVELERLKVRGGGCKTPSLRTLNDPSSRNGGFPFGYAKQGRLHVKHVNVQNFIFCRLSGNMEDEYKLQHTDHTARFPQHLLFTHQTTVRSRNIESLESV